MELTDLRYFLNQASTPSYVQSSSLSQSCFPVYVQNSSHKVVSLCSGISIEEKYLCPQGEGTNELFTHLIPIISLNSVTLKKLCFL